MRVVDLRGAPAVTPPTVEVRASAGAELLRLIGVLLAPDPTEFDIGRDRIAALRSRLPDPVLATARSLTLGEDDHDGDGDEKAFLILALLGGLLPEPGGVQELLDLLRDDPTVGWNILLAHQVQDAPEVPAELLPGITTGDPDAIATIRRLAGEGGCPAGVRSLLAHAPQEHGRIVREVVEGVAGSLWPDVEGEAMGPIQRDVAHRREQLAAGEDPAAVVLEATNGYELSDTPAGRRVVLLPSYVFRPWLVVGSLDGMDLEVISTVVADAFLALPSEAPPPALLKLFKALSDEGRLALLRRMSGGPISLAEATEEIGVTKATAHHHLSILRQAGLVSIRGEGRATRYALREDPATLAGEALTAYVPGPR